ncbi:FHA domain-containing protein [Aetokthonos hydrillicola Thurmond2011]|jgi:pSer/pThr/pTyr-binding forkhead associated (FHA) protein|uniref:FHA domain-containing protein n=1 Tax=Aetokthonos hydrillicola Thurmond2011 TaxID=2712845 RepID=A0AAP5I416_9CYAN|nr:FHA domain-containing protein [Aetokthonos hydrillicola]MBW4590207.1 FHA domain-containing protein [Aetokthonos hydrillicola CCALA 1050]MDR9893352.1 FHA domain-containing protein [Aetokthonos hydrillicola Thurmond2011]
MAKFEDKELERRLSLYQVFRKLYEYHSGFLEEILQLEDFNQSSSVGFKPRYVQAVADGSIVYVITNLLEGKTVRLQQPQLIWTIGRDRASGIHVSNRCISRRHAAIRYDIDHQTFYLIDFNSTNGSYINGEQVYHPRKLKDGDSVRLGNMTFSFFTNLTTRVLPTVALELLMQLAAQKDSEAGTPNSIFHRQRSLTEKLDETLQLAQIPLTEKEMIAQQKSEILDDFFRNRSLL